MERRSTIKDVAQEAGVSIATVSRVLNHNAFVTNDIKSKVLKAADRLNYIPNTVAKSLKTNRTNSIGFMISDISSEFLIASARAMEGVLAADNYSMILCSSENDPQRERNYLRMLMSKNVDGIVLNTTGKNDDYVKEVSRDLPMVLFNRKVNGKDFRGDLVDTNNYDASYELTRRLLQMGHRRIMVVRGPSWLSNAQERFDGFAAAMRSVEIDVNGENYPYIYEGDFSVRTGQKAVEFLMKLPQRPTAVFSQNVVMTLGVMTCARENNINIPDDISLVSYDGIPNAQLMVTRPTAAVFDTMAMGQKIGRTILERIEDPQIENRSFIFQQRIIQGNSINMPVTQLEDDPNYN